MADAVKAEKSKRRRKIPVNRVLLPRSGCFQFTASSRFILLKVRIKTMHHEREPIPDTAWTARNQRQDSPETQDRTKQKKYTTSQAQLFSNPTENALKQRYLGLEMCHKG